MFVALTPIRFTWQQVTLGLPPRRASSRTGKLAPIRVTRTEPIRCIFLEASHSKKARNRCISNVYRGTYHGISNRRRTHWHAVAVSIVTMALASCTAVRTPIAHTTAPPDAPPIAAEPAATVSSIPAPAAASRAPEAPTPPDAPPPTHAATPQSAPIQGAEARAVAPVRAESRPQPAAAPRANTAKSAPPARNAASFAAPPVEHTAPAARESAVVAEKPPSLDLAALEGRLRDTHAIGVFTKLSLKNQIDDLLERFRAFHRGQNKTSLAQLRQQYDLLLLKVLSLLQDSDQQLAASISSSREAIWGILTDPQKFAKI